MPDNQDFWSDIPGYEGYYQASRDGEIRSVQRVVTDFRNGKKRRRVFKSRILKHQINSRDKRHTVMLSIHGETKRISVHRLVCLTFHGHPPLNKPDVLHWDDDLRNNSADNLRWGNQKENIQDERRNKKGASGNYIDGRVKRYRRNTESRGNPILEPHQVQMVRKLGDMRKRRGLRTKLAKLWGVAPATLSDLKTPSYEPSRTR